VTIQERKDDLLSLAKNALDFQMEAPNTSLSLMRWMQYLAPYYAFLYLLCRQEKPGLMVEIGTECGMGCINMALGNPDGHVTTIDLHDMHDLIEGYSFFEDIHNIEMRIGDSLKEHSDFKDGEIDLLFIDGDHRYEYARQDYELWYPKVKPGGLILLDDTQLSEDMERFWEEIKEPKLDLSFIRQKDPHHPGRGSGFGVVFKQEEL